jgi:hypothetical protein
MDTQELQNRIDEIEQIYIALMVKMEMLLDEFKKMEEENK